MRLFATSKLDSSAEAEAALSTVGSQRPLTVIVGPVYHSPIRPTIRVSPFSSASRQP
jgi:hypothetical protein